VTIVTSEMGEITEGGAVFRQNNPGGVLLCLSWIICRACLPWSQPSSLGDGAGRAGFSRESTAQFFVWLVFAPNS